MRMVHVVKLGLHSENARARRSTHLHTDAERAPQSLPVVSASFDGCSWEANGRRGAVQTKLIQALEWLWHSDAHAGVHTAMTLSGSTAGNLHAGLQRCVCTQVSRGCGCTRNPSHSPSEILVSWAMHGVAGRAGSHKALNLATCAGEKCSRRQRAVSSSVCSLGGLCTLVTHVCTSWCLQFAYSVAGTSRGHARSAR